MSRPMFVCSSPRFFIVVETVVLGDPAVHLDPPPLLLPQEAHEERPGDSQRVHRITHLTHHLLVGVFSAFIARKAKGWFNFSS